MAWYFVRHTDSFTFPLSLSGGEIFNNEAICGIYSTTYFLAVSLIMCKFLTYATHYICSAKLRHVI